MLGIVIPVYNESDNIKKLFDAIAKDIHCEMEVRVVYDMDEDTTLPVVERIRGDYSFPIVLSKNKFGRGALNAIHSGMVDSAGEAVLVMMADLSDSLWVVDDMYAKIHNEGYDVVCGSRYMKGGKQHGGPAFKGFLSRMAGLSMHLLSGIPTHDVTNSFKMYRKSFLDTLTIESDGGFEIGMEITVKAYLGGYKVGEVPAEWFDRDGGESHFRLWAWLPHYLKWYFRCIFGKKQPRTV